MAEPKKISPQAQSPTPPRAALPPTSKCVECGSRKIVIAGPITAAEFLGDDNGKPYTHVCTQKVQCVCGKTRTDRFYQNRAGKNA